MYEPVLFYTFKAAIYYGKKPFRDTMYSKKHTPSFDREWYP